MSTDDADAARGAREARIELDRLLGTEAPALLGHLPQGFADAAEHYVRLLLAANRRLNLTRVVVPVDVARLHLLDALSALPSLDDLAPRAALDLGSGGGVPGLILAIARPDMEWTLVDSVRKKADALDTFVEELGLANVTVIAERAEVLGRGSMRETVDLVAARACAPFPVLAEYALPLVRPGGALLAWKGPIGEAELTAGASASRTLGGNDPELRPAGVAALGDHRFVVVRKVEPTPERYPRRPGEPARRPLG